MRSFTGGFPVCRLSIVIDATSPAVRSRRFPARAESGLCPMPGRGAVPAILLLLFTAPAMLGAQTPLDGVPFDQLRELDPWSQSVFGRSFTEAASGETVTELYVLGFSLETEAPVDDVLYLEIRGGALSRLELRTTVPRAESDDLLVLLGDLPERDTDVSFTGPYTITFPPEQRDLSEWLSARSVGIAYLQEGGGARGVIFEFPALRILLNDEVTAIDPRLVYLELWTSEQEEGLELALDTARRFVDERPWVNLQLRQLSREELRVNFRRSPETGQNPTLLWTDSGLVGEFLEAELLQTTEGLVEPEDLVATVIEDGLSWGVPVTAGNPLMLVYDSRRVSQAPRSTDELLQLAGGGAGLALTSTEAFWFAPWVAGYGGSLLAEDGITPTLDSPAVISALELLRRLAADGIIAPDMDYAAMNAAFLDGSAGMAFNGVWAFPDYSGAPRFTGGSLVAAPLPRLSETGLPLASWNTPSMLLMPLLVSGRQYRVAADFIAYATDREQQLRAAREYGLVPARLGLLDGERSVPAELVTQAQAVRFAVPQPSRPEADAVFAAIRDLLPAVIRGDLSPQAGAQQMQRQALELIGN